MSANPPGVELFRGTISKKNLLLLFDDVVTVASLDPGTGFPYEGGGGGGGIFDAKFELNPQRRPIWAWPDPFLPPKREYFKLCLHESSK